MAGAPSRPNNTFSSCSPEEPAAGGAPTSRQKTGGAAQDATKAAVEELMSVPRTQSREKARESRRSVSEPVRHQSLLMASTMEEMTSLTTRREKDSPGGAARRLQRTCQIAPNVATRNLVH